MCPNISACWDTCDVRVITTADALRGSSACNITVRSSSQRSNNIYLLQLGCHPVAVRTLTKMACFIWIFWQPFSARYFNTAKSMIGSEYTSLYVSRQPKFRWLRSRRSCRPVYWVSTSYPSSIDHCSVLV